MLRYDVDNVFAFFKYMVKGAERQTVPGAYVIEFDDGQVKYTRKGNERQLL